MAITLTARGTFTDTASATTTTFSPSGDFAGGSWAVIVIAADNSASAGSSNNITSVTDDIGNTWTKRNSAIFDNGAANAGVQGSTFTCPMDVGRLLSTTVITITYGANTPSDCGALWELTPSPGWTMAYGTGAVGTGSTTASPTITTSSISAGSVVIGCLYAEAGTEQTVTGDSDTSNGSWSTQQAISIGSTATGMTCQTQYKVVTGTATQTFNPTMNNSVDTVLSWISLFENQVTQKYVAWIT